MFRHTEIFVTITCRLIIIFEQIIPILYHLKKSAQIIIYDSHLRYNIYDDFPIYFFKGNKLMNILLI